MVPNVAKTGTSFKGAALYYLHDKREAWEAERMTTDRVAWTSTRNLATDNPDLAWRIMAATAMDQDRLKAEARVKNTGRKSANHVYAYSLAWHPDEAKNLSKAEMLRAADESIRVLGAEGHQAMIICHRDEPHPHVHVVLNRVNPETGRMLGTSNDRVKLSQWAEAYERERGKIWCDKRVENNARRAKGDFVRASSPTPRAMEKDFAAAKVANDNAAVRARDDAKARAAKLAAEGKAQRERHSQEWAALSSRYKERKGDILTRSKEAETRIREAIVDQYRPTWRDLYRRQNTEMNAFRAREGRLAGKIANAIAAISHRSDIDPENSRGFVSAAFNFITSRKAREDALLKLHALQKKGLSAEQKREIDKAMAGLKADRGKLLNSALSSFSSDRVALIDRQADEKAQLKAKWKVDGSERKRAFETIRRAAKTRQNAKDEAPDRTAAEARKRREHFQDASEGNIRRGGRVRKRVRTRREG
ncbi:relaxase/mobilization nuclease domain-containing protein [Sinorhizobium medicae]|uniref:relaxase/mobilization nuclease domain-containing protein n=1 Tax=Sinorhizobium medicae TaxID=110321 RepID=UPI001304D0B0|nr:relaxase/mobilization nuclease domain-containing protein [Sinorhizobium medicae]